MLETNTKNLRIKCVNEKEYKLFVQMVENKMKKKGFKKTAKLKLGKSFISSLDTSNSNNNGKRLREARRKSRSNKASNRSNKSRKQHDSSSPTGLTSLGGNDFSSQEDDISDFSMSDNDSDEEEDNNNNDNGSKRQRRRPEMPWLPAASTPSHVGWI